MDRPIKSLLVEDNPADARLVCEMLKEMQGVVVPALASRFNGACARLDEEDFDVILLDLALPDSQGLDTLRAMLAYRPHVPIVVITGLADESVAEEALRLGAQDYLIKGDIGGRTLVRAMRYAVERKNAEETIAQKNNFLTRAINALTHPFLVIDAFDYTIVVANEVAAKSGGTAFATCYGLTHRRGEPCTDEHLCPLEEVKRTKRPTVTDHVHFDKDGNRRLVEVHGYPIFDEQGTVVQMVEYGIDITERKKRETSS